MARPLRLPDDCRDALVAGNGLLTTTALRQAGVSSRQLARLLDRDVMVSLAKGVYAGAVAYRALEPWPGFALRTRAFVAASPPDAIAADWSAVALHGLPAMREPPPVPSVIRPTPRRSGSNRTCHGRTRYAAVRDRWIAQVDNVAVFAPAVAAVDLARHTDRWRALALADAAIIAADPLWGPDDDWKLLIDQTTTQASVTAQLAAEDACKEGSPEPERPSPAPPNDSEPVNSDPNNDEAELAALEADLQDLYRP